MPGRVAVAFGLHPQRLRGTRLGARGVAGVLGRGDPLGGGGLRPFGAVGGGVAVGVRGAGLLPVTGRRGGRVLGLTAGLVAFGVRGGDLRRRLRAQLGELPLHTGR